MLLQQDRESWTNDFGSGGAGGVVERRGAAFGQTAKTGTVVEWARLQTTGGAPVQFSS